MQIQLSDAQQRLVDTGFVTVVDKTSEAIPADKRAAILRGFGGSFARKGAACTLLKDDGTVLVIVDGTPSESLVRHEFIHAAQCFADEDHMAACLDEARRLGRKLVEAMRDVIGEEPGRKNDFRDLGTSERTWQLHASGQSVTDPFHDFDFFLDLFPTPATVVLAQEVLGSCSKQGAFAALTAAICDEVGYRVDPASDMAREIVAYTFEKRPSVTIDDMMENAAQALEYRVQAPV